MTEFELIARIGQLFAGVPRNGFEEPGDDCTVLGIGGGESLLFTADLLTEGIHFLRNTTPPYELGRKALAVNLSDVAAMGGRSVATLLSVALPPDVSDEWTEAFLRGYRDLSAEEGVMLAGGDTTSSRHDITVNVTVVGRAADHCIKRRSDARAGDAIVVAGVLGASGAGLRDLLAGNLDTPNARIHNAPVAQTAEGLWLGERTEVHAMTDLFGRTGLRSAAYCGAVACRSDGRSRTHPDRTRLRSGDGSDGRRRLQAALHGRTRSPAGALPGFRIPLRPPALPDRHRHRSRGRHNRLARPRPTGRDRLARVRTQRLSPYPQAEELLPSGKYSEKAENPLKRPIYSLSWEHNPLSYHGRFKRYLLVMLSALCGCTPTARLTNLTPQAPIPEDSVRIMQAVESPDSARKIADFRIRPIRMCGTARRAERDITRPLRRAAARNGAELAVVRTCSTRRFLWGRSHTAAGTLLTLRDCDAPYYAADFDPAPLLQRRGAETGHTLSAHNGSTAQTR